MYRSIADSSKLVQLTSVQELMKTINCFALTHFESVPGFDIVVHVHHHFIEN